MNIFYDKVKPKTGEAEETEQNLRPWKVKAPNRANSVKVNRRAGAPTVTAWFPGGRPSAAQGALKTPEHDTGEA